MSLNYVKKDAIKNEQFLFITNHHETQLFVHFLKNQETYFSSLHMNEKHLAIRSIVLKTVLIDVIMTNRPTTLTLRRL